MRGKILLKALEILEEGVLNQVDFFGAILASGYGASSGKIDYEYNKRRRASAERKHHLKEIKARKRRLQIYISQMKHDGLIEKSGEKLRISEKGKRKILEIKNKLPDRHYQKENAERLVVMSFDIPEKLRRKRNWLREVIRNLGFKMIHQSVWVGKIKIPHKLILDLEDMKILEFVEIFEITRSGSLKKIGESG